jgi:DNA (cytosine-5)-methyltransferase 1
MKKIGSLFTGAGGLDLAVEQVFGGTTVWMSEFEPAARKVLEHNFPGVLQLGDITQIDWRKVPPVDILTGGFPCQDVSAAGLRAGITDGTRSGLWSYFAEAIDILRPEFVVIENVRGLLSAKATHREEATHGEDSQDIPVKAMARVLADLSDLGYDAKWATVAAGSVGAPHKRERVFILAYPSDPSGVGPGERVLSLW